LGEVGVTVHRRRELGGAQEKEKGRFTSHMKEKKVFGRKRKRVNVSLAQLSIKEYRRREGDHTA